MVKGQENLKPVRSKEEARERGRKGGKASGKARREKATIKQYLKWMLEEGNYDGKSGAEAIATSAVDKAIQGDVKAMTFVRDTVGEKPVDKIQKIEVDPSVVEEVEGLLDEARASHTSDD